MFKKLPLTGNQLAGQAVAGADDLKNDKRKKYENNHFRKTTGEKKINVAVRSYCGNDYENRSANAKQPVSDFLFKIFPVGHQPFL